MQTVGYDPITGEVIQMHTGGNNSSSQSIPESPAQEQGQAIPQIGLNGKLPTRETSDEDDVV